MNGQKRSPQALYSIIVNSLRMIYEAPICIDREAYRFYSTELGSSVGFRF